MAKAVMIIAPENFRDEELFVPKKILEENGIEVVVASTKKGTCKGMLGGTVIAQATLDEIDVDNFDAVMFVGGSGTPIIRKEERALEIAKNAASKGKIVGAICWAPTTLAKAGILRGKKATVWVGPDLEYGKSTDKVLEEYGAEYVNQGVVEDGSIITADGPNSADLYARKVLEKIMVKS